MTLSYSLHVDTAKSYGEVLETLFDTDEVQNLEGAVGVKYTRGVVYLAHARETSAKWQLRFATDFDIQPNVSVSYFPDGVSSVNTALNILADAVVRWLNSTDDSMLLVANNTQLVAKRLDKLLQVNRSHPFWTPDRLRKLTFEYEIWQR